MEFKTIGNHTFQYIGAINLVRDHKGSVIEVFPQSRYRNSGNLPLNNYGRGPFCKFRVAKGNQDGGVYVIMCEQMPVYVGESENLDRRFSSNGYGGISPRNCFKGGQETNCRVNNLVLKAAKRGCNLVLWFYALEGGKLVRVEIETGLINELRPEWNRC